MGKNKKQLIEIVVLAAVCIALAVSSVFFIKNKDKEYKEVNLSTLTKELKKENISEIEVNNDKYIIKATMKNGDKIKSKFYNYDYEVLADKYIIPQAADGILTLKTKEAKGSPWYIRLLPTFLMVIMFSVLIYITAGKGMSLTGKAVNNKEKNTRVKFSDVRGMDEEKEELEEIVDFLKSPEKYKDMGARIPKGVLLFGKPGTGKTFISKAVAGEAGVPFFSVSGSEFVEMFVGLGSKRIRDLFKEARKNAPCIIFIDEIDAIGGKRGTGIGSGESEREQTLNQLLVEIDGFSDSDGIIVMGATNRPDVLDAALLRAGRFDRQVMINLPDVRGRESIFDLYMNGKKLSDSLNTEILAKRTPGFSPADIENLCNEAAIMAVRLEKDCIDMDIIEEAITKTLAGPEKKSRVISDKEKRLTAYHEVGHAITAKYLDAIDTVHQISIIPRGMAGGFTMTLPAEDKMYGTKQSMEEEIINLLGGRAAEMLKMDTISTGASNDIERATRIARDMVTKYGFCDALGPVCLDDSKELFLGRDFQKKTSYSESVAAVVDGEIMTILEDGLRKAKKILLEHDAEFEAVAQELYKKETISGDEFANICNSVKS